MISFDFFESGIGETIIITLPDGSLGVVDAFLTADNRGAVLEMVRGKNIRFLCLTHIHRDHSQGLNEIASAAGEVECFWSGFSDIKVFLNYLKEINNKEFYTEKTEHLKKMTYQLLELFRTLREDKKTKFLRVNDQIIPRHFDGLDIEFLWPQGEIEFSQLLRDIDLERDPCSPNTVSVVLLLKYLFKNIILGGDALQNTWLQAVKVFQDRSGQQHLDLFKVPHHGARNTLPNVFDGNIDNYTDFCSDSMTASIIFGKDKHPDREVFKKLIESCQKVFCLRQALPYDPALIGTEKIDSHVCNHHIKVIFDENPAVKFESEKECKSCANLQYCNRGNVVKTIKTPSAPEPIMELPVQESVVR